MINRFKEWLFAPSYDWDDLKYFYEIIAAKNWGGK